MVAFVKWFMLFVLLIDLTLYALFLNRVAWFFVGSLIVGVVLYRARLNRQNRLSDQISGWSLGPGIELTNPNKPQALSNVVLAENGLNLGMLVLGGPGAGKTESTAVGFHQYLFNAYPDDGFSYFEGKGDIDIYQKHIAAGVKFDYFFSSELSGSDTLNLFEGEAEDVIDRLSRLLIGETSSTSFYSDAQRAVISSVIPLMLNLGLPVNLRDLWAALAVDEAGRELMALAREKHIDDFTYRMADEYFSLPWNDRIKEVKGLLNRLMIFCIGDKTNRINAYQPDIHLSKAVTDNKKIYFHLPLSEYARDLGVAIVETYGVIARNRQQTGPTKYNYHRLALDDWGAFFHDNFGPISARCRSARMPLTFMFQSRGQLQTVSHTFETELDDTIATKIILRTMGDRTGDLAVKLLGEYEELDISTSNLSGRDGTNTHAVKQPRLDKRDLRLLNAGEAYISTLSETNGVTTNPLYKTRFPLPNMCGWETVKMPAEKRHEIGEGLHLWSRHMQASTLKQVQQMLTDEDHQNLAALVQ